MMFLKNLKLTKIINDILKQNLIDVSQSLIQKLLRHQK